MLAQNASCASATERQVALFFTATNDPNTEGIVRAYPNPVSDKIYLEFQNGVVANFQLNISNTNGQVLKNIKLSKETTQELDMSQLAKGVYFLQFSNEKQVFTKKIVKI